MPYIHFMNVKDEIIDKFSNTQLNSFSEITSASLENIYVINHQSKIVNHQNCAYVKIEWMPREEVVRARVVELLQQFLKSNGFNKCSIYFVEINKARYYTGELV